MEWVYKEWIWYFTCWIGLKKYNYVFAFEVVPQYWRGEDCWKSTWNEEENMNVLHIVMAADDPSMDK